MNPVFRLLVYAIVTVAILSVIYYIFVMPHDDPIALIKNQLEVARINEGKVTAVQDIYYVDGTAFQATLFDNELRSVAFECNNETLCCPKGQSCGEIEWDERKAIFEKRNSIKTSARCYFEHNIYVCKVYFGKKPAQVEIRNIAAPAEINLDEKTVYEISFKIENTGEAIAPYGNAELKLYQWQNIQGTPQRIFIGSEKQELAIMQPRDSIEKKFSFDLGSSGNYEIEMRVDGENSGFDANLVKFTATGEIKSDCRILRDAVEIGCDVESGKEKEKYYCENCTFSFECRDAWKNVFPGYEFQEWNKTNTYVISDEACNQDDGEIYDPAIHSPVENPEEVVNLPSATKIELQWSVPVKPEDMPIRNGKPKWDPFNHPYDTQSYNPGMYPHRYLSIHRGMDIYVFRDGTPVYAAADGEVIRITSSWVYLLHHGTAGEEYTSMYGHTKAVAGLAVGQQVSRGQQIATVYYPDVPHLHFEMYSKRVTSAAPSSKFGEGGAQMLENDRYLINPVYIIGDYS